MEQVAFYNDILSFFVSKLLQVPKITLSVTADKHRGQVMRWQTKIGQKNVDMEAGRELRDKNDRQIWGI